MICRNQHGVALLTAMLIIALVAIIGTAMLSEMNLALHRSGNIWESEQAWWYAIGVENWAGAQLGRDARKTRIDALDEDWAQPIDYLPLEGGALKGRIIDLQGRFNLNNLALANPAQAIAQFQRLIEQVTGTDALTAQTIADSTRDWVDPDINPTRPAGAEDGYYLGRSPGYRTGNTLMVSSSELRLVKGVTPAIFARLAPYICTLPEATPINVNTAPAPILQTLAPNLPASTGKSLVQARSAKPWKSVPAFLQESALASQQLNSNQLSVTTHYFRIQGVITVDRAQLRFYSVLQRAGNGAVHVIRHSTNAF